MNKTIYLKDDEGPIWERARELADDKLSPVIVEALKQFIAQKEAEANAYERIEVRFEDAEDGGIPKAKAFYGRWVFPPDSPFRDPNEPVSSRRWFAVAVTAKGAAVVYSWSDSLGRRSAAWFRVYASLGDAAKGEGASSAARAAMQKIGVPIEELDI
jgi:hypothetical protein